MPEGSITHLDPELYIGPPGHEDQYRLERAVWSGGEGDLHEAVDTYATPEPMTVAIKSYRSPDDHKFEAQHRAWLEQYKMVREWRIKGIVPMHGVFVGDLAHRCDERRGGRALYLVMGWAPGVNLHQWLREHPERSSPQVLEILEMAGVILGSVHDERDATGRCFHGDVSPANVMIDVDPEGRIRISVIDYGMSRGPGDTRRAGRTSGYDAPDRHGSPSIDIYGLGALAFYLFAGHARPKEATRAELQHQLLAVPSISDQPAIAEAIAWAMDPDPSKRPPTVKAWLEALLGGASTGPVSSERSYPPPAPPPGPAPVPDPRPRRRWPVVLAALLLLCGGLAGYLISQGEKSTGNAAGSVTTTTSSPPTTAPPTTDTTTTVPPTPTTAVLASWSQPVPVSSGASLASVSCATPTFCAASGTKGGLYTYDGNGWRMTGETSDTLGQVDCPTTTFCAAVGTNTGGDVFTFNGTSWSAADTIDPGHYLHSVSCASPTFCMAGAAVNIFSFNGSSWSTPPASVDSTNTGGSKTPFYTGVTRGHYGLAQVSCPTTSFCAIIDGWGNAFTYDGNGWSSANKIDPVKVLSGVSCVSSSWCVVTAQGQVMTFDGTSWSQPQTIDGGATLTGVSCPATSFCLAVDNHGRALTFNGTSWSSPQLIDNAGLTGVSCVSATRCTAVDGHGQALTWS